MLEILILTLVSLVVGFFFGKRIGYLNGFVQGKTDMMLMLRQESFQRGYCMLCKNHPVQDYVIKNNGISINPSTYTKNEE